MAFSGLPKSTLQDYRSVEEQANRETGLLNELMSLFGAFDAQQQNLAARNDPTAPALINSQLANYAGMMSGGGFDANNFLSGNFSKPAGPPVTFGAGSGSPFDIPAQRAGVDPGIMSLFNSIISPAATGQMQNLGSALTEFGPLVAPPPAPAQAAPAMQPMPPPVGPASVISQRGAGNLPVTGGQARPITSLPMPQYATGTPYVPQTGPAVVHQGEAIVPAAVNPFAPTTQQTLKGAPPPTMQTMQGTAPGALPVSQPPQITQSITPQQQGMVPPAPAPVAAPNPLQMAIESLQTQLQSGGPINANVQNIMQQQLADQTGGAYQQQLADLRGRLGGRGLGGSGLQFGLENSLFDSLNSQRVQGQNQIGLEAANQNWGALQQGAGNLANTALGAGQFGLQQQNQQFAQQQSLFNTLLEAIRKSQVDPSSLFGSSVTIAPAAS